MAGGLGTTSSTDTPDLNTAVGNFQPSPDFSHLAFSSQDELRLRRRWSDQRSRIGLRLRRRDRNDGTHLRRTPTALTSPRIPSSHGCRTKSSNFPGPELRQRNTERNVPERVDRRVAHSDGHTSTATAAPRNTSTCGSNDAITYEIADGVAGQLLRHDIGRDEGLLHLRSAADRRRPRHQRRPLHVERAGRAGRRTADAPLRRQRGPGRHRCLRCLVDEQVRRGNGQGRQSPTTRSRPRAAMSTSTRRRFSISSKTESTEPRNLYVYRDGQIELVDHAQRRRRRRPDEDPGLARWVTCGFRHLGEAVRLRQRRASTRCTRSTRPRGRVNACPASRAAIRRPPTFEASLSGFFMSDDGRTFFSTTDALVAQDTNEGSDVYEYVEGRPQLISTGTGPDLQEADGANHSDHADGRQPERRRCLLRDLRHAGSPGPDNGAFLKFYDARTGGGFEFTRQISTVRSRG